MFCLDGPPTMQTLVRPESTAIWMYCESILFPMICKKSGKEFPNHASIGPSQIPIVE